MIRYSLFIKILFGTLLVLSSFPLLAQGTSGNIDSLNTELRQALRSASLSDDLRLFKELYLFYHRKFKLDSVGKYNDLIIETALKSGDSDMHIEHYIKGLGMQSVYGKLPDSTRLSNSNEYVRTFLDKDINSLNKSNIYNRLAINELALGNVKLAISNQLYAVSYADSAANISAKLAHRILLSQMYQAGDEYNNAVKVLFDAEKITPLSTNPPFDAFRIEKELGVIFKSINDFVKSESYLKKALNTAETNSYSSFRNEVAHSLGELYYNNTMLDEASKWVTAAIDGVNKSRLKGLLDDGHALKLAILTDQLKLKEAKYHYDTLMILINDKLPAGNGQFIYRSIANYGFAVKDKSILLSTLKYVNMGKNEPSDDSGLGHLIQYRIGLLEKNPTKALVNYQSYISIQDSISKTNNLKLIQRIESEYNRKQQESEIKSLNQLNIAQDKAIAVRNTALTLGAIMLLFLSGLLWALYRLYQKNQQNQIQLAAQNVQISKALEQNQMLIKEIHHRVKNNLQVISSLLSMQERKIEDEGTKDALKSSKTRVQSMSILHQSLYQGDNLKDIDVDKYMDELVENIIDTYQLNKKIDFKIDVDPISLDIDTLVPLGLITNELISNALKHAFVGRESGNINVSLKESNTNMILTVADDGVGFEGEELPLKKGSLGARLITSFTQRLDGKVKIDQSNGTKIQIIFYKI